MHDLETIKRLNAKQQDEVYPESGPGHILSEVEPSLHPLVAASIISIEHRVPLTDVPAYIAGGHPSTIEEARERERQMTVRRLRLRNDQSGE